MAYSLRHFALLKLEEVIQPHRLEKRNRGGRGWWYT